MNTSTYTRTQAMERLGLKPSSRSAFMYLRNRYPKYFIVINQGTDRGNPTLYDKAQLDKFIEARKALRNE
jgi:hypothetical protein